MIKGIARRIDGAGRLVIPSELRKKLDMAIGDEIEIIPVDEGILLKIDNGKNRLSDFTDIELINELRKREKIANIKNI